MKLYKSLTSALKEKDKVEALKVSLEAFPDEILQLTKLKELYLEGNCQEIDPDIIKLQHLKILTIKFPLFKGNIAPLFTLPALENLKIIETPLEKILLPMGQVSSPLKHLTLKDCGLSGLPEEISMLNQLNELQLPSNKLSNLPASFRFLHSLKRLNLDNNSFSIFPDVIKLMKQLSHLSIDQNLFNEEEKARIQREYHIWVS